MPINLYDFEVGTSPITLTIPSRVLVKKNKRTVGTTSSIDNETHAIPGTAPYVIKLEEVPLEEVPSSIYIIDTTLSLPLTEVTGVTIGANQFKVDYSNGQITFNSAQASHDITVDYEGIGSFVYAEDVNELQGPILKVYNTVDSITSGFTSDWTFPNDVTILGDLDVKGAATYLETQIVTIADNILTLNADVTASPTENCGIEIERGTSTNVSVLWNESNDSWSFIGTAGSPLITALDSGYIGIGLVTPTFPLHVVGSINYTGNLYSGGVLGIPTADIRINADLNFNSYQALNFRAEVLVSDPTPTVGTIARVFYNSTERQFKGVVSDGLGGAEIVILG